MNSFFKENKNNSPERNSNSSSDSPTRRNSIIPIIVKEMSDNVKKIFDLVIKIMHTIFDITIENQNFQLSAKIYQCVNLFSDNLKVKRENFKDVSKISIKSPAKSIKMSNS